MTIPSEGINLWSISLFFSSKLPAKKILYIMNHISVFQEKKKSIIWERAFHLHLDISGTSF
jgi:hypothetical protein